MMLFSLPVIIIDLSGFQGFINEPLPIQLWTIFVYGGWVPFVWVLLYAIREVWLNSRQAKYAATIDYVLLNVNIGQLNEQSPKAVEHIFSHIAGTASTPTFKEKWWQGKFTPPFSFEYAVIDGYTRFIIRAPVKHRDLIEAAVFSQYSEAEITEVADYTQDVPQKYPDPEWEAWGSEFVMKEDSAFPIRTWFEFEHSLSQELKDPLSTVLETFSKLKKGEQVWMQILCYPIKQGWVKDAQKVADRLAGKEAKQSVPGWAKPLHLFLDLFEDILRGIFGNEKSSALEKKDDNMRMMMLSPGERKRLEGVEMKMAKIGFGVKIRFVYVGKRSVYRKGSVASMMKGSMGLFGRHDGNTFGGYGPATPASDYFWQTWSYDTKVQRLFSNYVNRSSMGAPPYILNVEELATIYHFPSMLINAPLIQKVESRKVEPPFRLPKVHDEEEDKES